jgi:hypothetical protein
MKPDIEAATTPQPSSVAPAMETKPAYLSEDWLSVMKQSDTSCANISAEFNRGFRK